MLGDWNLASCPVCGKPAIKLNYLCNDCEDLLASKDADKDHISVLKKQIAKRSIRNVLVFGIMLAVTWELLSLIVPEGTPLLVVNIITLNISILIFWWPLLSYLRVTLSTRLAMLVSLTFWLALFVGLRFIPNLLLS